MSAATEQATSASISTPVLAVVRASATTVTVPASASTSISAPTFDSGSWWASGISSSVRLAAWMPAIRATAATSPFGASPAATLAAASGDMRTTARARAIVRMSPGAAAKVAAGDAPKGDVAAVARIAGIQAAKRTDELIPLCHQLPLTQVDPQIVVDPSEGTVTIVVETRTTDRTGVEMEAMVASSVGAVTIYDMVKGMEPGVVVERVELLDKTGGKSDFHRA